MQKANGNHSEQLKTVQENKMTVKEFKELIDKAEKEGKINADSEIFVLNEEDQVMSEPALFIDSDKDLVLKYSYQNEVLIQD